MGNSLGCSASGERLVSAARDGDLIEARMLLEFNPGLAKYSTFGGLNSPLHFAAAKSHNEMVMLLLENGADVNSRNYCGQTALMQACRHGHWEIVQTLFLYRCNVTRADYLSGRTALHFAAVGGHVRCVRLLVADFVPSSINYMNPVEVVEDKDGCRRNSGLDSSLGRSYDQLSLTKFINKIADGGLTALHMAALNGSFDCVHLLLDLHADVSSVTFPYGSSMNLIGAGSTPLHYAACGGNLKCCQVLLSRGSSRLTLNCNGWLPVDVAKIWGHHALEALLKPNSVVNVPTFLPSNFLSLPLMSILNIARDWGLQSLAICDNAELCPVCLERSCSVVAEGCSHELCVKCALYLCSSNSRMPETEDPPGSVPCPLCRRGIVSFSRLPCNPIKDPKPTPSLSSCNPCILHPRAPDPSSSPPISEFAENHAMPSELICPPLTCSPFPSVSVPTCNCKDGPCPPLDESPRRSQSSASQWDKFDDHRLDRTNCSRFCWSRRSCHREHQCNAEINA